MTGETDLNILLRTMSPQLNPGEYVFSTIPGSTFPDGASVIGSFREAEGLTLILERSQAQAAGLEFDFVMAWITLNVQSSLQAVGLTAAFATALGAAGISANVIAGFYHDHIFVGLADGERAMAVLRQLARDAGAVDNTDVEVGRED
ncbi:ACT domain-containing protein [Pseudomonas poae]|nr:ACT domain-containing protein [Pseudomonas poae]